MKKIVEKLNNNQIQAIKHGNGPLLIIAGAGTGKTTVITDRIKYLIIKGLVKPEEILALTFTEKGAKEMEERIDVALPLSYGETWVMTFHSFCDRILRESAIEIGLSSNYKLMTTTETIDLIKKNLFEFELDYFRPLGNPNKFIEGILQHFSRLQDELVSTDDYLKYAKDYKQSLPQGDKNEETLEVTKVNELARSYKKYTELKIKENVMDFGDLVVYANKLFKDRPNVLKRYQEKFKYVLVDEFQDTNFAQNELVNLLVKRNKNLTVVGDDNQSIYRWRGAAISNILQFKKNYPNAKVVTLNKNYRSTQTILDSAYRMVKFNDPDTLEYQLGISKKLTSMNKKGDSIKVIHTNSASEEAEKVVKEICSLVDSGKYSWKDIAILVRANNHSEIFIHELERQNIPHQFLGPSKLLEKEEIVDLISYLKVLYSSEDSVSMYRLLSSENVGFSSLDLIKAMSQAKKVSKSLFEVVAEKINQKEIKNDNVLRLFELLEKHLKVLNKQTAGEILYDFVKETGIYQKLIEGSNNGGHLSVTKAKNISKFFEKLKSFEENNKDSGVAAVVDYLDLLLEVGESPSVADGDWQENDAVNILTLHSSKGLEFKVVFLVNLVNDRFPSRERHEQIPIPEDLVKEILPKGDYHMQEERRLFYVGMTRAKEKLFFTLSDYYGDAKRIKKESPFIVEALEEKTVKQVSSGNVFLSPQIRKVNKLMLANNKKLKIDYLSVSQIETFKTCPMHYKLKYIYKIPIETSASISFGVSIHNTLKDFYTKKGDIIDLYKSNWIEDGFINKKHKQEFYKKGEHYLLGFLENGYNPKVKTIALEEKFNLKIDETLKIGGTIDRVDELVGGSYEIIDYKTGANIPTQKEVDKDMQLSFYALATSTLRKTSPENIKLSLYYLDTQEKITTRRTKEDLENLKKEILEIRNEIEISDFKCNNNYFCQGKCEYSMFCKQNTKSVV